MALLIAPLRSILLPTSPKTAQLAAKIAQDSPTCSQDRPRQPNLASTWLSWLDFLRSGFHSGPQTFQKPLKTNGFSMFFDIQPDSQEASKIIRNWSQKLPTSSQDRHLGCIWRPLGRHLGALGRHLGSSWRSWAPSWLILGLLGAILAHLKGLGRHLAAKDVATALA